MAESQLAPLAFATELARSGYAADKRNPGAAGSWLLGSCGGVDSCSALTVPDHESRADRAGLINDAKLGPDPGLEEDPS